MNEVLLPSPAEFGVNSEPQTEVDKPQDKCGVVGIASPDADTPIAQRTLEALRGVQHRGYDAAGLAILGPEEHAVKKDRGHIMTVFPDGANELDRSAPSARFGMGHTRYSTVEGLTPRETKRAVMPSWSSGVWLVENGNVPNAYEVADAYGIGPEDCITDATAMTATLSMLRQRYGNLRRAALELLPKLRGAYCMVISDGSEMIVARDPQGIKPFSLGRMPDGSTIAASETVALDRVNATWQRDVEPGEVITFTSDGKQSSDFINLPEGSQVGFCGLEIPYLMDPLSRIGHDRQTVWDLRKYQLGYRLAQEHPTENPDDYTVVGMPKSGIPIGLGYAKALEMSYDQVVTTTEDAEKSFLSPTQALRKSVIRGKLVFDPDKIQGRRLKVVDDSGIRGNTAETTSEALYEAGAESVEYIFAFPMVVRNCHLGVAMSEESELLAHNRTLDQMARRVKARSVRFMSVEGYREVLEPHVGRLCLGCVGGDFPVASPQLRQDMLPLVSIR
jgi:amidophosphoribosyltransferase